MEDFDLYCFDTVHGRNHSDETSQSSHVQPGPGPPGRAPFFYPSLARAGRHLGYAWVGPFGARRIDKYGRNFTISRKIRQKKHREACGWLFYVKKVGIHALNSPLRANNLPVQKGPKAVFGPLSERACYRYLRAGLVRPAAGSGPRAGPRHKGPCTLLSQSSA